MMMKVLGIEGDVYSCLYEKKGLPAWARSLPNGLNPHGRWVKRPGRQEHLSLPGGSLIYGASREESDSKCDPRLAP